MKLPSTSGKIHINLNERDFADLDFSGNTVQLSVKNPAMFKRIFLLIPKEERRLSHIHRISRIISRFGLTFEIHDSKGLLMKMGKGAHSLLGNVEVKLLRIRKYI